MDVAYGMAGTSRLLVLVELRPDRRRVGRLRLLARGAGAPRVLFRCRALGLADTATALKAGNPARDPLKPFGDAPCGHWTGCRLVARAKFVPKDGIGPRWIPLHHRHAADEATRQLLNPRRPLCRWELGIHAGWGNGHLMLTQGCIRVRDEDFDRLAPLVGDEAVDVHIAEVQAGTRSRDASSSAPQRTGADLTI